MPTLTLTVAQHDDNEFYDLGRITPETPVQEWFDALPTDPPHVCDDNNMCIMVDLWEDDANHTDDREISRELADELLFGRFDVLLEDARRAEGH